MNIKVKYLVGQLKDLLKDRMKEVFCKVLLKKMDE
jgi:hypothetical protein